MMRGIEPGLLLAIVMLAISSSSKPGFSKEKTDSQAPFVTEVAFQYAAVNLYWGCKSFRPSAISQRGNAKRLGRVLDVLLSSKS